MIHPYIIKNDIRSYLVIGTQVIEDVLYFIVVDAFDDSRIKIIRDITLLEQEFVFVKFYDYIKNDELE